jgi:hypothetical protein
MRAGLIRPTTWVHRSGLGREHLGVGGVSCRSAGTPSRRSRRILAQLVGKVLPTYSDEDGKLPTRIPPCEARSLSAD